MSIFKLIKLIIGIRPYVGTIVKALIKVLEGSLEIAKVVPGDHPDVELLAAIKFLDQFKDVK